MAQVIEIRSRDATCTDVSVTSNTASADGGRIVLEFSAVDYKQPSYRLAVNELEAHRIVTGLAKALLERAERRHLLE